jgi:hypothetical protein
MALLPLVNPGTRAGFLLRSDDEKAVLWHPENAPIQKTVLTTMDFVLEIALLDLRLSGGTKNPAAQAYTIII